MIIFQWNIFLGKRRWRQEKDQTWFSLKNTLFGHILKKPSIFASWCVSWSTFDLHLVRGPNKCFKNWFFKRLDHGSWTMKSDHGKRPSSMVWLHGPWCKPALRQSCKWCTCDLSCFMCMSPFFHIPIKSIVRELAMAAMASVHWKFVGSVMLLNCKFVH